MRQDRFERNIRCPLLLIQIRILPRGRIGLEMCNKREQGCPPVFSISRKNRRSSFLLRSSKSLPDLTKIMLLQRVRAGNIFRANFSKKLESFRGFIVLRG